MLTTRNPKYDLSDIKIGISGSGRNPNRNYSTVKSLNTAASSKVFKNQYSSALMGGGPNIYDRLTNDSMENLMRPSQQMNNRVNTSNNFGGSAFKWPNSSNNRQYASANIRKRTTTQRPSV